MKYLLISLIPFIGIFVVSWLPFINGPHLWFGMPSLFVWLVLFSTIPVTGALIYIEKDRQKRSGDNE